ncbi:hypothetical protein SAMN05444344_1572 [Tenacibaculum mesophilum]|uniref:DUF1508 domain-containing protein n=1 Tax=Tenacibaculum mesophilum TaxID=104268 RepID=A0ABN5T8M8_9FLAO|nr:hypothetical protein [Tenacibaculum mesophilum]AZJ32695.1 hypothetical protein D6200_09065 [Tenacibaculum mesophilum]QFS27946.1 hypothetical protein F9Y86_05905 [Tenacibaculum mesophilum]SHF76378.1 hypothetical protein SAMN05444344_1572 [Tenacibaculum mesophilum]
MSAINEHINIPKNISTKDDLDFSFLRKEGISYLEKLGGKLWTDFNSHDPGVTILEMLCYAITDLGMRIDTPLENLLASKDSNLSLQAQFYKASEIFPTKPVNELDYRKLFIDLEGVKNCWLRIYDKQVFVDCKNNKLSYKKFEDILPEFQKDFKLKGLYSLLVDLEEGYTKEQVFPNIKTAYHENRNLCEDLIEIKEVDTQPIAICANVDVIPEADEEWVYANILFQIENYLSPSLKFYSIQQMLDKGYATDEVFDGPILKNGFIDVKELKKAELRKEVRLSDVMKIIMNIEGVKLIKDISVGFCDENIVQENKWVVCIDPDKKPVLCEKSTFNFSKGFLPLNLNYDRVDEYLKQLKEDEIESQQIADEDKVLSLPKGSSIGANEYTTIQNDFPDTYGIGQEGLAVHVTNERKAKAKQLKAYLTFFDQILATYFKHLSEVKTLLSISGQETRTFFTQAIKDIKDFDELISEYPQSNDDELTKLLFNQFDNNVERRNSILDHLLARFAERFGEYTFIMKALYGTATDEIVLLNKEAFLKDYKVISSEKGLAFNYYKQNQDKLWYTNNVSGFQKRIARLMGVSNERRRYLTETSVDIYEVSEGSNTYRWRLKDTNGNILLSATENYAKKVLAIEELYFAVLQIVQTKEKDIKEAFEEGITNNMQIGFIRIHKSTPSKPSIPVKYSFDVINPEKPKSSSDYIIAKQYKYYTNINDLKEALLEIISFLKKDFTEEGMFLVEHMLLRPDVTESYVEIYEEIEGSNTYRWKLRDNDGNILLSAQENYASEKIAVEGFYLITQQVLQIKEIDLERAFKKDIVDKKRVGYIRIHNATLSKQPNSVKYWFNIVNREKHEDNSESSLAKSSEYENRNALKNALKKLLCLLKKDFLEKGIYNEEQMILRPKNTSNKIENFLPICAKDCEDCGTIDPYSYRVSIVLPGYTYRFSNPDFRRYMEDVIRQELPSHILPRICWVGERKGTVADEENDLLQFENAYKTYLYTKTNLEQKQPVENNELLDLIQAIQQLNTIYPSGRLTDCNAEDEALEGRIILNQSSIGNIQSEKENNNEENS